MSGRPDLVVKAEGDAWAITPNSRRGLTWWQRHFGDLGEAVRGVFIQVDVTRAEPAVARAREVGLRVGGLGQRRDHPWRVRSAIRRRY